ncbi:acyl-CoA transferase/carnitine dehydratase [Phenylobacterium zucineum HLK1]|uniref:Acyl-CoA transferase/carnitine dehydratase n=1 Tax=Phenylobacterium zucineum (strain HLK1) TaxID=450851 RepID=B4RH03_PHEZH|nr:CaiB/BaiF CoA-transferase family protein [Phenylobacterium zucineum]ACG78951.1 acyl-CoA transferase/carnitine dehydratase [Phenylobacterium zucineum HLK1]
MEPSQTPQDKLPLSGVRVLDLSRMVAAPWATQILGDLGAEVIKVERPGVGDDMRGYGPPFLKDREGRDDDSPYHLAVNRNKKSITVNLASPEGRELIRGLAAASDVLVENYKVGDLKRHGLDYESLAALNPNLVYCSVTGFGQTGPYAHQPGLDSLFQAMSGLMSITGDPDVPPQKVGVAISDFTAGMYATVAIFAALRHRDMNGGGGQHIDISLLDCQMAALSHRAQTYLVSGEVPQRNGASTPGNQPAGLYAVADGQIILSAGSETQFANLARALGRPEMAADARFATRQARVQNVAALTREMEEVLATRPRRRWIELFQAAGVMCAPINTIADAFEDPQVRHRGIVVKTPHPTAGETPLIASPIRLSKTPVRPFATPPRLGQHTEEVLGEVLGMDAGEIEQLRSKGAV